MPGSEMMLRSAVLLREWIRALDAEEWGQDSAPSWSMV
jgi:hypothetical protein